MKYTMTSTVTAIRAHVFRLKPPTRNHFHKNQKDGWYGFKIRFGFAQEEGIPQVHWFIMVFQFFHFFPINIATFDTNWGWNAEHFLAWPQVS